MPNIRAYNNRFCSRCDATELHRDNCCLQCERDGIAPPPPWQPKPTHTDQARLKRAQQRAQNAGLANGSARRLHAHQRGVALTVKTASQRNRDRIEKALSDPRVVASRQEGEGQ